MSKGLEALWEFRLLTANYENQWSKGTVEHFIKCADTIEKELKILEIIKEKVVLMDVLLVSEDANDYNDFYAKSTDKHLTEEEFRLLKEVLK